MPNGTYRSDKTPKFTEMTDIEIQEHFKDVRVAAKQPSIPRVRDTDLNLVHRRLLDALKRDTDHLLRACTEGKLNQPDSQSLVNYLKLIKDLKRMEEEENQSFDTEELEKIAAADDKSK